jgi:transposase InsO family protein
LRSDRGGEYNSKEFDQFCEDISVERQVTIDFTLEQNGVAERKNRTIVEMAKTKMKKKGLLCNHRVPQGFEVEREEKKCTN